MLSKQKFRKLTQSRYFYSSLFIVGFALIGIALLLNTMAATPTANLQAENGTVNGPAVKGTDTGASGGGYVQFKAASTGGGSGSKFTIDAGGIFHDPSGTVFRPMGANLGVNCSFGWGGNEATGNSGDAQNWNWSIIRLDVLVKAPAVYGGGCAGLDMTAMTKAVIDEYTAKHIVVEVAPMDTQMIGLGEQQNVLNWVTQLATQYKNNPYVWYNCFTEPGIGDQQYIDLMNSCIDTVRSAGATSPVVLDNTGDSNEGSWDPLPRVFLSWFSKPRSAQIYCYGAAEFGGISMRLI